MNKEEFSIAYREICNSAAEVLFKEGMGVFEKMMPEEVESMQGMANLQRPGLQYRLPKIVVQIAADQIAWEFGAESSVKDVKRLRRILKRRM